MNNLENRYKSRVENLFLYRISGEDKIRKPKPDLELNIQVNMSDEIDSDLRDEIDRHYYYGMDDIVSCLYIDKDNKIQLSKRPIPYDKFCIGTYGNELETDYLRSNVGGTRDLHTLPMITMNDIKNKVWEQGILASEKVKGFESKQLKSKLFNLDRSKVAIEYLKFMSEECKVPISIITPDGWVIACDHDAVTFGFISHDVYEMMDDKEYDELKNIVAKPPIYDLIENIAIDGEALLCLSLAEANLGYYNLDLDLSTAKFFITSPILEDTLYIPSFMHDVVICNNNRRLKLTGGENLCGLNFVNCDHLEELDLSELDLSGLIRGLSSFSICPRLKSVNFSQKDKEHIERYIQNMKYDWDDLGFEDDPDIRDESCSSVIKETADIFSYYGVVSRRPTIINVYFSGCGNRALIWNGDDIKFVYN